MRRPAEYDRVNAGGNSNPVFRAFLFQAFTSAIEQAGVDYCILAGYDRYPEEIQSDVDFMIRAEDLPRLPSLLAEVGRTTGAGLVQILRHETTAIYFALAVLNGGRTVFLHPDSSADYRRSGRIWLYADALLARRRRHSHGFFVPSAENAFVYYLIKKLDKGELSEFQAAHLSARFRESPQACRQVLASMFSSASAELIAEAAATESWDSVRRKLGPLRAELHGLAPPEPFGARLSQSFAEVLRRVERVLSPTGLCVAVMGPDGAGKSTVIQRIIEDLAPAFRRTHYQHLRPNLAGKSRSEKPVTDPHGVPPRGLMGSLAKLGYFLADYLIGYWLKIRPMLVRSTLVVFDRYYHDILIDARRYRYGAPAWLARWVSRLVPKPDLWLILDAPAEVLQARKPEVSFEESARQGEAYRGLARELDHAVLIDASLPVEAVLAQTHRAVLTHLARRTAARLDIEPVIPLLVTAGRSGSGKSQ